MFEGQKNFVKGTIDFFVKEAEASGIDPKRIVSNKFLNLINRGSLIKSDIEKLKIHIEKNPDDPESIRAREQLKAMGESL